MLVAKTPCVRLNRVGERKTWKVTAKIATTQMKIKNRNRIANMKHKMKIQNANGSTLSESQTNLLLSMGAQTKVFQFPQWHWPGFNLFSSTSLLLVSDVWAQKATIKLHYSIRSGYPFDFDLRYRFRWLHCIDGKLTSALFRVTDRRSCIGTSCQTESDL